MQDQITFAKPFLEPEPKCTNPTTFVSIEKIGKRKRLCSHGHAESENFEIAESSKARVNRNVK